MSAHVRDKAQRLLENGRVAEDGGARVFRVLGDLSGSHTVVISDADVSCSCEAGRRHQLCSHLLAARVFVDREVAA